LGIAALEDKIVQSAVVTVLNRIARKTFGGSLTGSVPDAANRGPRWFRGALDALYVGIRGKKVNWILDMDLKGFFDNIDKEHLMEMVERRIADARILRLIRKWLNAGVIEDGEWPAPEKGTPGYPDGAGAFPATGRPLLVRCAGTAQPKAAHLGKAGETIRSLASRATCCS
jgi:hypothetical protein